MSGLYIQLRRVLCFSVYVVMRVNMLETTSRLYNSTIIIRHLIDCTLTIWHGALTILIAISVALLVTLKVCEMMQLS